MNVKAVIFDFNGTLYFDSEYHHTAWEAMSQLMCQKPLAQALPGTMLGLKNIDIIHLMDPSLNEVESEVYSKQKEAMYREICLSDNEHLHLVEGAIALFDYLKQQQIPFTIASASIKDNIDFFVETFALTNYFDPTKILYDDGTYLSKVEMYRNACAVLEVDPKDVLVFEDSAAGISHAKESGIGYIVGVGPTNKHASQIELGANECINDFTQFNYELCK